MKNWILRGAAILGVLISSLLIVAPAMAMWDWCDVDPTLSIGSHTVSIMASVKGDPQDINGKIKFYVVAPEDLSSSVISTERAAKVKLSAGNNGNLEITADIKTKAVYEWKIVVLVDGAQTAVVYGTTNNTLYCTFPLQ